MESHRDSSPDPAQPPLFYVVDWLPPDFGAVGQYALIAARQLAASGRDVTLVGLTRAAGFEEEEKAPSGGKGRLRIQRLRARRYEKSRFFNRLLWTIATNMRLVAAVLRQARSHGADVQFTGAPPFMLFFILPLKYLRRARLIYRITDFYPEAIIAHLGRRPMLLALLERITWFLRKRVDEFEVLGEDQRQLLVRGGIPPHRITVRRDTSPVTITGHEPPRARPPALEGRKILLYSGNYGVAHEFETVAQGLDLHYKSGRGGFGLWLNATGHNADGLERRMLDLGVPVARTPPVTLAEFPALLAAADVHLITLRSEFSGIVFPSKVYACLLSRRPILFVGPASSDVHLLCTQAGQRYVRIEPGDAAAFAQALDELAGPATA